MRTILKLLIAALPVLPISASPDFSGTWNIEYSPSSTVSTTGDSFKLVLIQEGQTLCGFHYGTARGTAKIDWGWADDKKPTVYGQINSSGTATVTLHSSHSEMPIKAQIAISEGRLVWLADRTLGDLPPTIPESATLASIKPRSAELRGLKSCSEGN